MQKARRPPTNQLRPLVSVWFQVLFTPLLGVLFTFPSRYWFTIGLSGVFSLTRWCWQIQTGFHRSRPTQDTVYIIAYVYRTFTFLVMAFPETSTSTNYISPTTFHGFGLVRVRSPLLAESLLFSFLQVLRCFSSPGYRLATTRSSIAGLPHSDIYGSSSFAPPRSFSQLTTSFVVSESLGIPHTPLFASYS